MEEPTVLGVWHTIRSPDYQKTMDYLRTTIQSQDRVSVESPYSLEKILNEITAKKIYVSPNDQFLHNLCILLAEQGASITPVEDMKLYRQRGILRQCYMFEGEEELEKHKHWQRLSIWSSIRLLELAQEAQSDYLICGVFHAYDLQKMGYPHVQMVSEIPPEWKVTEDEWIQKFGKKLG